MSKNIKALSVRQPWPWVIFRPDLTEKQRAEAMRQGLVKDIENRDWKYPPSYRGQLLIHASKTFDFEGAKWIQQEFPGIPLPRTAAEFNRGGFVGLCRLSDVVEFSDSRWFFGPLGFKIRMQKPIKFIPYKGQLGLFDVPEDVISRIEVVGADGRTV